MNNAIQQFRPASNWISVALISLFVVSFTWFAEAHTQSGSGSTSTDTEFCTGVDRDNHRLFILYY